MNVGFSAFRALARRLLGEITLNLDLRPGYLDTDDHQIRELQCSLERAGLECTPFSAKNDYGIVVCRRSILRAIVPDIYTVRAFKNSAQIKIWRGPKKLFELALAIWIFGLAALTIIGWTFSIFIFSMHPRETSVVILAIPFFGGIGTFIGSIPVIYIIRMLGYTSLLTLREVQDIANSKMKEY